MDPGILVFSKPSNSLKAQKPEVYSIAPAGPKHHLMQNSISPVHCILGSGLAAPNFTTASTPNHAARKNIEAQVAELHQQRVAARQGNLHTFTALDRFRVQ